jgi:hypothetical protein
MGPKRDLTEAESDLRATSEDLVGDAGRLRNIEKMKTELPAGDPRVVSLAEEAKALADRIATKASVEVVVAKEVSGA